MNTLQNRRTIRKYSAKEVSDSLLNRLLETAERTPTMGNLQLYSVVVTRQQKGKERLAPAHFHQKMVTEAPVVLTICADFTLGRASKSNTGLCKLSLVYERSNGCFALHADLM